jgi:hypothetical protein
MEKIPIGFDSSLLIHANIQKPIEWDLALHPHLLVLGNTGSGKSYFLKLLLGRFAIECEEASAIACCYKNALLPPETPNFYGYTSVIDGFTKFETELLRRLESGSSSNDAGQDPRNFSRKILVLDEYVGWLASVDDKQAKGIKQRMARLLTMARSLNMTVILGATRGMADNFSFGSRDCLNVIFLGDPSKESIRSFCSSDEAAMIEPQGRGAGYTVFDGQKPVAITVPTVRDMEKLDKAIYDLLSRWD